MKFEKWIMKFVMVTTLTILVLLSLVTLFQVVMRYVFQRPPFWSEELARYLMVWISFLGFNIVLTRRSEMAVTFFADRFPARFQLVRETIVLTLIIIFLILGCYFGTRFSIESITVKSIALRIPMTVIYISLPFSFFLSAVLYIVRLIHIWTNGSLQGDLGTNDKGVT